MNRKHCIDLEPEHPELVRIREKEEEDQEEIRQVLLVLPLLAFMIGLIVAALMDL